MANATIDLSDWRRELVALLSSADQADWRRAFALRNAHLPRFLYRYRAPVDTSFRSLLGGTVWVSNPSGFNDLYDTSVMADAAQGVEVSLRRALTAGTLALPPEIIARLRGAVSLNDTLGEIFAESVQAQVGADAAARARTFFRDFALTQSAEMSSQLTRWFQSRTKVACFSEEYDNDQLWAHYAANHSGFCIEYPMEALPERDFGRHWMWPVVYTDQRFDLLSFTQALAGRPNIFAPQLVAMHKGVGWAYEREWRIVDPTGDPVPGRHFSMPNPSRVFLGARMSAQDRNRITHIARSRGISLWEVTANPVGSLQARRCE